MIDTFVQETQPDSDQEFEEFKEHNEEYDRESSNDAEHMEPLSSKESELNLQSFTLPKMSLDASTDECWGSKNNRLYIHFDENGIASIPESTLSFLSGMSTSESTSNGLEVGNIVPEKSKAQRLDEKKNKPVTSGSKWFDMPAPEMTPELARDIRMIRHRGALDTKRHYKRNVISETPRFFQVGTIIEGPTEYYNARLTRRERRKTLAEELMREEQTRQSLKRRFMDVQGRQRAGGKAQYRAAVQKRGGRLIPTTSRKWRVRGTVA